MINVGDNNISVYVGDSEVSVYAGDELLYPLNFGELTAITLTNLTWVTDIPFTGGTGTSANCSYVITGYYDSGKTRKLNSKTTVEGEITASSTTSETRDLVGTLVLTATCSGFSVTGSVDAYQEAYIEDYSKKYLTFKITSNGNIRWMNTNHLSAPKTIQYSKDNGATWSSLTSTVGGDVEPITGGTLLPVVAGDIVMFKGNNSYYGDGYYYAAFEGSDAGFEVYGNIMSMIAGDDFATATTISGHTHIFRNFFGKCIGMTTAEHLILPSNVYQECYAWMFQDSTSLTTAPVLPATSGVNRCYHCMFRRCSSLNYINCRLVYGTSNIGDNWVNGVAASGTFVKTSGSSWSFGNNGIPSGWTVLEE